MTLVEDLKGKGTSTTPKRGTPIKNIRPTDDPAEIECHAERVEGLVPRTGFLAED